MKTRLSVLLWLLLVSSSLLAQTFRGTILGTVTDPQGAVVAGAKVAVHNVDTGLERTTQTSADGSYAVPELPIGTYTVTVTQSGFQTAVTSKVAVNVAAEKRVDVVFRTGQVSEKVEVSGETLPIVETTTDTLGGTFTAEQAKDLPLNGRDFQKMIFLTPGVSGSPDEITDSPGSFGIFSMNGARGRSNNFLLDGTDMNDGYRNDPAINEAGVFGTPATILPVDAIQETQVVSNFMPEYGRNAGATVNIVTKSGTNALHGNFFDYFRNDGLDATNYFNSEKDRAPFHNNQFGGSLGGPIVKDKTFFYFSWESFRNRVGASTSFATVPTEEMYNGDFRNWIDKDLSAGGKMIPIYNPFSLRTDASGAQIRDPFPNNQVPTNLFDPLGVKALAAFQSGGGVLKPNVGASPGQLAPSA